MHNPELRATADQLTNNSPEVFENYFPLSQQNPADEGALNVPPNSDSLVDLWLEGLQEKSLPAFSQTIEQSLDDGVQSDSADRARGQSRGIASQLDEIRRSSKNKLTADHREWIFGSPKRDEIDARDGRGGNHLFGRGGQDILLAGRSDRLYGNGHKDILSALDGRGGNRLYGGGQNDRLFANRKDVLLGNRGRDYLDASQGRKNRLKGGKGHDWLLAGFKDRLHGHAGHDVIWSGEGKNRIRGGKGRDQFWILDGDLPRQRNIIQDFRIGVDLLGIAASEDIRRFTDLELVQQGDHTLIQVEGTEIALLKNVRAERLRATDVLFDPVYIPDQPGAETTTTVRLVSRAAQFENEMGVFFADDARGRIGDLLPGDKGYAEAALTRRLQTFSPDDPNGTTVDLKLEQGQYLGWYLIQNGTTQQFLRKNPSNKLKNKPLAFFSFGDANPDGMKHLRYRSGNRLAWEDLTYGGDRSFDDLVFEVDFSFIRGPETTPPFLSIPDVIVTESDGEPTTAIVIVTLSEPSEETITVDFATEDGTGKAGEDYTPVSGSLTFSPGETTKEIRVSIISDDLADILHLEAAGWKNWPKRLIPKEMASLP